MSALQDFRECEIQASLQRNIDYMKDLKVKIKSIHDKNEFIMKSLRKQQQRQMSYYHEDDWMPDINQDHKMNANVSCVAD